MRYAHVVAGVVENVSLWDEDPEIDGVIPCPDHVSIGFRYENGEWCIQEIEVETPAGPDHSIETAKAEAKAALLAALPEGTLTQEQMDLLFGPNGDPIP